MTIRGRIMAVKKMLAKLEALETTQKARNARVERIKAQVASGSYSTKPFAEWLADHGEALFLSLIHI